MNKAQNLNLEKIQLNKDKIKIKLQKLLKKKINYLIPKANL